MNQLCYVVLMLLMCFFSMIAVIVVVTGFIRRVSNENTVYYICVLHMNFEHSQLLQLQCKLKQEIFKNFQAATVKNNFNLPLPPSLDSTYKHP